MRPEAGCHERRRSRCGHTLHNSRCDLGRVRTGNGRCGVRYRVRFELAVDICNCRVGHKSRFILSTERPSLTRPRNPRRWDRLDARQAILTEIACRCRGSCAVLTRFASNCLNTASAAPIHGRLERRGILLRSEYMRSHLRRSLPFEKTLNCIGAPAYSFSQMNCHRHDVRIVVE